MTPRPTRSSGVVNVPSGACPSGNWTTAEVVGLQRGAELESGGRHDRLAWVRAERLLLRLVLHQVVGSVREPASGEDGDGEDGEDPVAHEEVPCQLPTRLSRYPMNAASTQPMAMAGP